MKKLISLLFALCLLAFLVACGSGSDQSEGTNLFLGTWNCEQDDEILFFIFNNDGTISVTLDGENRGDGTYIWENNGRGEIRLDNTIIPISIFGDQLTAQGDDGENYIFTKGNGDGVNTNEIFNDDTSDAMNESLEGEWYNFDMCTIEFDGENTFYYDDPDESYAGTYTFDGQDVYLYTDDSCISGYMDEDSDLLFDSLAGYFSLTSESSADDSNVSAYHNSADSWYNEAYEDGTSRYWDYECGVTFRYPSWMLVENDGICNGVLVGDNSGGYVIGRNVTDWYNSNSGTNDDFIDKYFSDYVCGDFEVLYGSDWDSADYNTYYEQVDGRIATGDINIYNSDYDIYIKVIIYNTDDNDVIAKSFFASYSDDDQFSILYDQVVSMYDC